MYRLLSSWLDVVYPHKTVIVFFVRNLSSCVSLTAGTRASLLPMTNTGMSISPTPNPLKHVLNAIGEDVEWLTYGALVLTNR